MPTHTHRKCPDTPSWPCQATAGRGAGLAGAAGVVGPDWPHQAQGPLPAGDVRVRTQSPKLWGEGSSNLATVPSPLHCSVTPPLGKPRHRGTTLIPRPPGAGCRPGLAGSPLLLPRRSCCEVTGALASRRGQAWLVARRRSWGRGRQGLAMSEARGRASPEGAAFPARVGSMGCNYTAPGPQPAGRERELARRGGRGSAPRYFDGQLGPALRARPSGQRSPSARVAPPTGLRALETPQLEVHPPWGCRGAPKAEPRGSLPGRCLALLASSLSICDA